MPHPYGGFEGNPVWRRLDAALRELERNGDVSVTTSREHVVGYLCAALFRDSSQLHAAAELCDFMSEISERAYSAGWMDSLEYDLWSALHGGECRYGHLTLHDEILLRLRELSDRCGGWIASDDESGLEVFVPYAEWVRRFEALGGKDRLTT
jgi:hypothetical protein